MSYGVRSKTVHKNLRLDKRANSSNWYARLTLENGKRIVRSTKTDDFEEAKERAIEIHFETRARIKNNLPAQTRKFKHVAEHAIHRMEEELKAGHGKQAYNDYISALKVWLIPYFSTTDVDKIDLAALTAFDEWRTKEHTKGKFSQSGINNHNAALNRVLDEAELNGWIVKSMRPTLLNKGVRSESRGSFTEAEHKQIYTALRAFHNKTTNPKAAATRETLRNYALFLANTGIRHGTEALGLRWHNVEWYEHNGEKYLVVNVNGKTGSRSVVARDTVKEYLFRQHTQNPRIDYETIDELIAAKSDEFVFVTRQGQVASIFNLNRAFNALLKQLNLKVGSDQKERTLYSYRHYYATRDLSRGMGVHQLAAQLGTSTKMVDKHYSKYSSLHDAMQHSGRVMRNSSVSASNSASAAAMAFEELGKSAIDVEELLIVLGVNRNDYVPTEEIKKCAMSTKRNGLIDSETFKKILRG